MQLPEELQNALMDWASWPLSAKPDVVRPFHDGLNNQAWLISAAGQPWVIKLFAQPAGQAIATQQWAAKLQLAPEIVFAAADSSYAVMPYLTKRPAPGDTPAIAASLRYLHTQPAPDDQASGRFDLLQYCDSYLQEPDLQAAKLHESLRPLLQRFVDDSTPPVFCHNDLVSENCLLDAERCVFIDWEFAQLNNPWWDLASVIVYQGLDQERASRFIGQYDEASSKQAWQPICSIAQCAVLWLDMLWHLQREGGNCWDRLEAKHDRLQSLAMEFDVYF